MPEITLPKKDEWVLNAELNRLSPEEESAKAKLIAALIEYECASLASYKYRNHHPRASYYRPGELDRAREAAIDVVLKHYSVATDEGRSNLINGLLSPAGEVHICYGNGTRVIKGNSVEWKTDLRCSTFKPTKRNKYKHAGPSQPSGN